MSKETFYVGVDVGQDEVWAVVVGRKPRSFKQTVSGVRSLRQWVSKAAGNARVHLCMEATGVYSYLLGSRLHPYADTEVSIVNPAQIKAFARAQLRRTKTDQVDARVILAFAISQHPRPWKPESPATQQLYQLVTQLETLKADRQEWRNRLRTQGLVPNLAPRLKKSSTAIIRSFERQIAVVHKQITRLCNADPELRRQVKLLCSVDGFGKLTAVSMLASGKRALTERSDKALTAHTGLAPCHRQSGTSLHGKSTIAKQGDKRLRRILYMPALVASQHNPIIRSFYQRLIQGGKPKKLALVACMRKLLLIARAILISGKPFNPNYQPLT